MSKFEAELRLPCKQPYAYINIVVRGETIEEFQANYALVGGLNVAEDLLKLHSHAYDVVMGVAPKATPHQLIESELGGKIIAEQQKQAAKVDAKIASGDAKLVEVEMKPWERPKPAAKADPNDPFANFK